MHEINLMHLNKLENILNQSNCVVVYHLITYNFLLCVWFFLSLQQEIIKYVSIDEVAFCMLQLCARLIYVFRNCIERYYDGQLRYTIIVITMWVDKNVLNTTIQGFVQFSFYLIIFHT